MNTSSVLVGLLIFLVGLGGGYYYTNSTHTAPTPHAMDTTMEEMTSKLQGKTGDEFDKAFIGEMILHHEGAVAMAKMVLQQSERPELIKLANDIIVAQTNEINMMHQWNATWFTPSSTDAIHHNQ